MGSKTEENNIKILNRLLGHEGVIFKINFNNLGTLMTSVSDDRSIRLWKLTHSAADFTGEVEHLLVLYGHSARVWDAKMLQECIVSIGEDAVCNVWSYDGKLIKRFSGHKGIIDTAIACVQLPPTHPLLWGKPSFMQGGGVCEWQLESSLHQ
jgi:WD40 repeat protein